MTRLETALLYLDKGLSVIPLYSPEMLKTKPPKSFREELQKEIQRNKESGNPLPENDIIGKIVITKCKTPCISGWRDYQHRLPTKEEVTHWFTTNPLANIAIITGAISNLVVFDLDSEDAVQYAEDLGGFPESVRVKTGRGYHVYMKHPGFEVRNQVKKELDIDIRADGGYVAAPPSIHGSGHQYEWEEGFSISQIGLADCTPWMIDYLKDISSTDGVIDEKQTRLTQELREIIGPDDETLNAIKEVKAQETKAKGTNRDEYLDLLQKGCNQGSRNQSATRLIGHLLKSGKETEVWELIKLWNRDKVHPPLDHEELKKTFESVNALEKKNQTATAAPKINIESYLDGLENTVGEYQQNYVRIPFANSNLTNLQKQMNGGFAGGRFYLFGGIPSSGKTVLLNNIADNICLNNYPVLFFSYDDGRSELRYRTFSRFSSTSIEEFNHRTVRDIRSIWQIPNIQQIIPLKYVIERNIPIEKWPDLINQIQKKHGKAPAIINAAIKHVN